MSTSKLFSISTFTQGIRPFVGPRNCPTFSARTFLDSRTFSPIANFSPIPKIVQLLVREPFSHSWTFLQFAYLFPIRNFSRPLFFSSSDSVRTFLTFAAFFSLSRTFLPIRGPFLHNFETTFNLSGGWVFGTFGVLDLQGVAYKLSSTFRFSKPLTSKLGLFCQAHPPLAILNGIALINFGPLKSF